MARTAERPAARTVLPCPHCTWRLPIGAQNSSRAVREAAREMLRLHVEDEHESAGLGRTA